MKTYAAQKKNKWFILVKSSAFKTTFGSQILSEHIGRVQLERKIQKIAVAIVEITSNESNFNNMQNDNTDSKNKQGAASTCSISWRNVLTKTANITEDSYFADSTDSIVCWGMSFVLEDLWAQQSTCAWLQLHMQQKRT